MLRPHAMLRCSLLFLAAACAAPAAPPAPEPRFGDEIVVCGQRFRTGTPVVLWTDPDGYDAYQTRKRFTAEPEPDGKLRYGERRNLPADVAARVAERGWTLPDLQQTVHQFVLHYDAAGTARQCFKVLQDVRTLSVHFLLDVDGTIYQTLDLQERAWHATVANDFAVGVEIAHPGAWTAPRHPDLLRWYEQDHIGWRMKFPGFLREPGVRTRDFVPRPMRPEPIEGPIHGRSYWQPDFTPEQYRALAHLCAALSVALPRIRLEVPRAADGGVNTTQLAEAELRAFDGLVGHFHVQRNKSDPGPALHWELLLEKARTVRANRTPVAAPTAAAAATAEPTP